jgi:outer membrane protein TolC
MKWWILTGVFGYLIRILAMGAEPALISMEVALRLADAKNLSVELARERVREARSQLDQDRRQLFPWVAPGVGYRRHDGQLQDIVGDVFGASKQSGTAALTLQAQVDLGDSLYKLLATKQAVLASQASESVQRRETALAVALAYTELSRATAAVSATEEAKRVSARLVAQIAEAVSAGLAFSGEVQRAQVQHERNESQRLRALEAQRVASGRLAQLLRLPPADELRPDLSEFVPIILVSTNQALETLVSAALRMRPELRRTQALAGTAKAKLDGVRKGPWIPALGVQAAIGGLAGGRNGDFQNADDFQDYGLGLSWRVGPGGIGDRSRIQVADARLRIALMEQEQSRENVVREVVEMRTRADMAAAQLTVAERMLQSATRLLELTQGRKEFGVGAVLEAIEAERDWSQAQAEHLRAIADYNRIQWEFWQATGQEQGLGLPSVITQDGRTH